MHELSLIKNLLSLLDKEIASADVKDVKVIYLEVGRLRYIVEEIMQSAFKHIPKHDKLKNAELKLEVLPVKLLCKDCNKESQIDDNVFKCLHCNSNNVDILSGKEFILKSIEW